MNISLKRPKKVLVGTRHLYQVGGSELYTIDLLRALKSRQDVEVEFFTLYEGELSERVEREYGIPFMSKEKYDIIFASHTVTVDALRKRGPVIQICHGIFPEVEQPFPYADYHVGISQEICDHLQKENYASQLVLNGLDLEEKRPQGTPSDELKTVLSLCQSEEANELLAKVCIRAGVELFHYNKNKNPTFNIQNEINKADMVVGIGRSIYDAMACGRPCIVFDWRDYNGNKGDGYLHPHLFEQFVQTNCSGRYRNLEMDEEALLREFGQYNANDGLLLRRLAEERLDIRKTAEELLQIEQNIDIQAKFAKWKRVSKHRLQRVNRSIEKRLPKFG